MLKKSITFVDFNGHSITQDYFFHLSKAELVEMELSESGGLKQKIEKIVEAEDSKAILGEFKALILKSYGVKSEDGRRFIKDEFLLQEFQQTGAYSELFMELAQDAEAAAEFVNGIVPEGLAEDMAKIQNKEVPLNPIEKVVSATFAEDNAKKKAELLSMSERELREVVLKGLQP